MRDFQRDMEVIITEIGIKNNGTIRFPMKHANRMVGDVKYLDLSDRSYNVLCRNGIITIEHLCRMIDMIRNLRGAGKKVVKEINTKYMRYYYDLLSPKEREDFWREVVTETEKLAELNPPKAKKVKVG